LESILGLHKKVKNRPQYSLYRGTKYIRTTQLLFQQRKGKTLIKLQYGMHKFLGKGNIVAAQRLHVDKSGEGNGTSAPGKHMLRNLAFVSKLTEQLIRCLCSCRTTCNIRQMRNGKIKKYNNFRPIGKGRSLSTAISDQ
jgi:hypothetical protein